MELDKNNPEFNNAVELVQHSERLIYLTGKAGTGKTTFLKHIKEITKKNTVVVAPTGVAAVNAGGQTIHSFFQIKPSVYIPNDKRLRTKANSTDVDQSTIYDHFKYYHERIETIKGLELLIIDEVSMVRCDLMDVIDRLLRVFRRKENEPFGGVQVLLIGDTFQLPPIATPPEWNILKEFYTSEFFFSSKIIEQEKPLYIELKKIYRQNEQEFIDLLNRIRVNDLNRFDLETLNSKYDPAFTGNGNDYIILATHNAIVNATNQRKLNEIESHLFTFEARKHREFPASMYPADQYLELKVGAQIMFVRNDSGQHKRYYSGKIGKIENIINDSVSVIFEDDSTVEVEQHTWYNIRYTYNVQTERIEEEEIGSFTQYPIRLAWAITVHKSQGLTFDKVIADLSNAFAAGQVYVALSRCTSFNGLVLKTQIGRDAIRTNQKVLEFAQNETPETLIIEQLNTGKADRYYNQAREEFLKGEVDLSFKTLKKAFKYRNDLDTDTFKKYISVHVRKLFSYKDKADAYTEKIETLTSEVEDQNRKILEQSLELSKKSYDLSNIEATNIVLRNNITKANEEIRGLKKELESLNKRYVLAQDKISDVEKKFEASQTQWNKTTSESKAEIERLKNLKWYEKLMGKN